MLNPLNPEPSFQTVGFPDGCVLKPIIINVSGVNTHLPAILMFTRATFGFDPKPDLCKGLAQATVCHNPGDNEVRVRNGLGGRAGSLRSQVGGGQPGRLRIEATWDPGNLASP